MAKQNIGKDLTVSFTLGGQTLAQFGLHTSTHFRPQWKESRVQPTNNFGLPSARTIFGGHEVELTFARVNATADAIGQFLEDNYVAGNPDVDVALQKTVRNSDGGVDTILYTNGILYPTDDGDYKGVDEVPMTMKMFFTRKQVIKSNAKATVGGQPLKV